MILQTAGSCGVLVWLLCYLVTSYFTSFNVVSKRSRKCGSQVCCFWNCEKVRCSFAEWQRVIEIYPYYLSAAEARHVHDLGMQSLHFYLASACVAANQSKLRWLVIPKMHLYHHLSLDVVVNSQNCRAFHCFSGEDFMGFLKKLCISTCTNEKMEERVLKRALVKLISCSHKEVAGLAK